MIRTIQRRVDEAARRASKAGKPREPTERTAALYPPLARASAVEGFAVVEFGVTRHGKTADPIVVDSEPPFVFEGTALRAVRAGSTSESGAPIRSTPGDPHRLPNDGRARHHRGIRDPRPALSAVRKQAARAGRP